MGPDRSSRSRSCCPYAIHKGALRGLGKHWKPLLIYSIVEIVLPWPLIGFGEQRVSSGLAAILIAAVPLVVALMALRVDPDERAEGSRLVGLLVGFAGVVVLLGLDVAGRPGELLGALAILLAAVGYAAGPMIIKHRFAHARPARPGHRVDGHLGARAHRARARLGARRRCRRATRSSRCSCSASPAARSRFLLFFALIDEVGPGRATVITYVNPVVAVALGVDAARRGARPDRRRRPAADPRRLVALDRRPAAARADAPGRAARRRERRRRRHRPPPTAHGRVPPRALLP